MKILFITYFFPPYKTVASIRTGKVAKGLHEIGHEIKVVSARIEDMEEELKIEIPISNVYQTPWFDIDKFFLQCFFKKNNKKNVRSSLHSNSNQMKYKFIKSIFHMYKNLFYNPDKFIGWYKYGVEKSEQIIEEWKPDVILSSGAPYTGFIIASKLSQKYNIPYVADLRDLWADNHHENNSFLSRFLEKKYLSNAKALLSVSSPLVDRLKMKYKHIPCFEIRNAFDREDFIYPSECHSNKIKILYTGMIYAKKQDPSILFKIISENTFLKENIEVDFYGNSLEWVKTLSEEYHIEKNVYVYNSIDREQILRLQSQSDILLIFSWNDTTEKGIYTGKIFEYIGSQKPILVIGHHRDDVISKMILENNFGLVSDQKEEIVEFIKTIRDDSVLGRINQAYAKNRNKFERQYQVKKLSTILQSILEN